MFPFDQPAPTAFYLTLYLGTFVLHVLPMAYVVAGSAVLLVRTLAGTKPADDPLMDHLRQWLPFVLSAAITAGVAPLLFLQILYRREFYTANLLLFNRWMAILPVLIVAFYALYLTKGQWLWRQSWPLRAGVALAILACFLFIGWSWTENHLLSLAGLKVWTENYSSGRIGHWSNEVLPRIGVWLGGVFAVMPALVAWPLARGAQSAGLTQRLALMALGGLAVSLSSAVWYATVLDGPSRTAILGAACRAWQVAIALGIGLQVAGWIVAWRAGALAVLARWLALIGVVLALIGGVATREALRTSRLDLAGLVPQHQAAANVGGFWLFALCLLVNAAIIAGCVYLVARHVSPKVEN
ncbi:MAG TPA: hypothetical protein VFV87_00410 [Pirellulaceae bacterium]|nr:hypothetical protein [Pirellulaceae bacterium]